MKNAKFLFVILLPIHLIFLIYLMEGSFSYLNILYLILGYIFIGGLGVEIGLHRWASHKSIDVNIFAKYILTIAAILSCQGHPIWWATIHRGYHHRNSDKQNDIHSPCHGKIHSFINWILIHDLTSVNYRYSSDLLKDNFMHQTSKYYEIIIWITWVTIGFISFDFLIWFLIIPTLLSFHGVGLINTYCHSVGYRNFNTDDKSTNIPLLGYLLWGNGWHNNHHYKPSSFDFGQAISGKKWEIDPCKFLLPLIKKY